MKAEPRAGRIAALQRPPQLAQDAPAGVAQRGGRGSAVPAHEGERGQTADAGAEMDHRLRRLSTILWAVGILLALLATNTPGGRDYNRLAINAIVIPGALLSIAAVWCFPWQRYHRDLFVVTIAGALVVVPLMIAWSGGWRSPFVACLYFIVVFAALYFPRRLALLIAVAVTLALASPLLFGYAPPGGAWGLLWLLLVNGATCLAIVVVGRAMADEMLRLYGETLERLRARQRAEEALQRVNDGLERRVAERTADLMSANAALRRSEERYRELFDNASDLVYTHDLAGNLTAVNTAFERLTGYTREEALRLNVRDVVAPEDRGVLKRMMRARGAVPPTELRILATDGRRVPLEISPRLIQEGGRPVGVQGIARDVTERKRLEAQLQHQAFHDPLTGLPNRALFQDRLEQVLRHARRRQGYRFAVLFLDLDRFKTINDSLGHLAGDQLLATLAQRLTACVRAGDTVARLGGDEFAILLDDLTSGTVATEVAARIEQALTVPLNLDGHDVYTTASIGIVLGPGGYEQTEELLRDADIAMYQAKAQGKARHVVFDPGMHLHAVTALQLEHDLRRALERAEFRLHYQPIVALGSGQLRGFEALVRWQHPERGLVSPAQFIPIAEETGLIVPLGWWVLREACRQLRAWQRAVPAAAALTVSVNLSAKQFTQPDLLGRVEEVLAATGLAGEYLRLEITESAIMENAIVATAVLTGLQALGVQVAIDDFGTGYSSLSYLKRFPLDLLKIDKAFVDGLGRDPNDTAIVQAIINLAHTLGLQVTAEGVESAEHVAQLRDLGCGLAQGYHFGKPMAADAVLALLAEGRPAQRPPAASGPSLSPATSELRLRRIERDRRMLLPTGR